MFGPPRRGNQDDKAHPPIHPVKNAERESLEDEKEWKIYELLSRHFLATLSKNAVGD
jgi:DNA topoisomerase-3